MEPINSGHGVARSCVREDALSVQWESVPCEVTTREAEGNCIVPRGRVESNRKRRNSLQDTNLFRRDGVASLRAYGEALADRPAARASVTARHRLHGVVEGGMFRRQSGVSGET